MPEILDQGPTGEEIYLAIERIPKHQCSLICLSTNAYTLLWKFICSKLPAAIHLGEKPHEITINGCRIRNGVGCPDQTA